MTHDRWRGALEEHVGRVAANQCLNANGNNVDHGIEVEVCLLSNFCSGRLKTTKSRQLRKAWRNGRYFMVKESQQQLSIVQGDMMVLNLRLLVT